MQVEQQNFDAKLKDKEGKLDALGKHLEDSFGEMAGTLKTVEEFPQQVPGKEPGAKGYFSKLWKPFVGNAEQDEKGEVKPQEDQPGKEGEVKPQGESQPE